MSTHNPQECDIPYLTRAQMAEVDRAMVDDFRIELMQMMENAGRMLAQFARQRFLDGTPHGKKVIVLVGSGGNGGGALVAARHLHNWGALVVVTLSHPEDAMKPIASHQFDIVRRLGIPVCDAGPMTDLPAADLVIDGLVGYSLNGPPTGETAELIRWANEKSAPILALDIPSGLDADEGAIYEPVVHAAATLTLALPKHGLQAMGAEHYAGETYLADIGVPPELYARPPLNLKVGPIFAGDCIVRLK